MILLAESEPLRRLFCVAITLTTLIAQAGCSSIVDSPCQAGTGSEAGNCEPILLASALVLPGGIAVDERSIFCTMQSGSVIKIPKEGGVPAIFAFGPPRAAGIAVDKLNVYWVSRDGAVLRAPKDGGDPVVIYSGPADPLMIHVAVDVHDIYWPSIANKAIMKSVLDVSMASILVEAQEPLGIAVDEESVYWSEQFAGTIMSVPKVGGSATMLVPPGQGEIFGIAIDATHVYGGSKGSIFKVPKVGGAPVTLSTGVTRPEIVAVDGVNVYWTDAVESTFPSPVSMIMRVSVDGGLSAPMVSKQQAVGFIALDETSVYWTDIEAGTIMKMLK